MVSEKQEDQRDRIGRYQLIEKLGEGAMAVVYKAFDPEINRILAIKLLREDRGSDPEYHYRFLSEAKAAGKLTHPNIVTIFDVGEAEEGSYIAMEYLEGGTLEELFDKQEKISLRDTVIIGIQLAEALHYSDSMGVVHRDIKPGNIVSNFKENRTIKITDFGIAHINDPNKESHTVIGTILGTPHYMSPEQVEGLPVDGRSDLFSTGIILYQMITGERPFTGLGLTSLMMNIMKLDPPPLNEKVPDIPASLQRIIERLLNKKPEKRFQNGKELADALRRVIREIDERNEHAVDMHILPLRVKWTVALAAVVSLSMIFSLFIIHDKQVEVMTRLAQEFGSSLAKFIATESAEEVLVQDWIALEVMVKESHQRQEVNYLDILDIEGTVRGSTREKTLGKVYRQPKESKPLTVEDGVLISEWSLNGEMVFDFEAPILFQNNKIGVVHIGVSQSSLNEAANVTLITMIVMILAVAAIVIAAAYLLASRLTTPMKILEAGMRQISRYDFSYRIGQERNDELGRLFIWFNRMADKLEHQQKDSDIPGLLEEIEIEAEDSEDDFAELPEPEPEPELEDEDEQEEGAESNFEVAREEQSEEEVGTVAETETEDSVEPEKSTDAGAEFSPQERQNKLFLDDEPTRVQPHLAQKGPKKKM